MSVVINTNAAATVAANNLAASNTALQKSLNRLSSGSKIVAPSDDAGGLAVSMKLSAAARRQGAVETNIANATSLLQTQDGVLSVTAKILNRISELKVLNNDVTKSSSDKANYNSEFKALQSQITANADEKFNGVALFGTNDLGVAVTEDGKTSVTSTAIDMLGTGSVGAFPTFTDQFADFSNWVDDSVGLGHTVGATGGIMTLTDGVGGGADSASTKAKFSGPFELTFGFRFTATAGNLYMSMDSGLQGLGNISQADAGDTNWHTVRISMDASGAGDLYLDGVQPWGGFGGIDLSTPFSISLSQDVPGNSIEIRDFSMASTSAVSTPTNVGNVASATDLSSLDLTTITGAIEDTATYRAQNGATQSRLGFASELVTVNKANLEAATSRITDVDVAQESTVLARNNVLVSAGTSMLAQANQSSQMALKLLS